MQDFRRLFILLTRATGVNFLLQQAERHCKAVQRGGRRWRATRDVDIYRDDFIRTAPHAVEIVEDPATVTAGTVGDTDFRVRRGLPRTQRRGSHCTGDRAGKQ